MDSISPVFQMFAVLVIFSLYTITVSYYSATQAVKNYVKDFDAGYKPGRGKKK